MLLYFPLYEDIRDTFYQPINDYTVFNKLSDDDKMCFFLGNSISETFCRQNLLHYIRQEESFKMCDMMGYDVLLWLLKIYFSLQ